MQGKKDYQEKLFTSFQLSERVPADNLYRRLKEVLDLKWLYKATAGYYGTEGQRSIDPVVFFKLILIGYLENLASDRRIINMVSMRMDMLYFIGYDIDEALPWHSTLSRTRQLYSQDVFKELFQQVLTQCINEGMVAGRRQAIDSVFVKANASMDSLVKKEVLADAAVYADSLTVVSDAEQPAAPSQTSSTTNATYYSPVDPDAKIATKPGKAINLNYLAQVSVDTGHHVITNIEGHHANKRDSECLGEVIDKTKASLQARGLIMEEIMADTNYSSIEALECLEKQGITGYIPNHGSYKPQREGFVYDEQSDSYTCSQGAKLHYKNIECSRGKHYKKTYYSSSKDCRLCPLRSTCIGKGYTKKLTNMIGKEVYDRMHHRMQTRRAKWMMKLRKSTVEPVLGTLVNFLGMRKVNTRGIVAANKCMLMAATVYNLKKLLKFSAPKVGTAINELKIKLKTIKKVLMRLTQLTILSHRSYRVIPFISCLHPLSFF